MIARRTATPPGLALALLTLVYMFAFVDRQLLGILAQPLRHDLGLNDTAIGWLTGPAFAIFYTIVGVPVARMADRGSRVTIVSVALALWSGMTMLCGLAQGFPQLFLARMGVGIGEAGCAAPSQSLIAALHAPERRATALSIFSLGVPAGMMLGAIGGGWLAQTLGWRWAFVGLGLPGILLALIVRLLLREPPAAVSSDAVPDLRAIASLLLRDRRAVHMAAGASLASFAGYGFTGFVVTLAVRRFALPIGEAATGFGLVAGLAIGLGIGSGGWLADRIGRPWAGGLVAGGGVVAAALLFELALGAATPAVFALAAFLPLAAAHLYFGPTYAAVIDAVPADARATAIALLLLVMNLIGLALGPLATGWMSDHFAAVHGPANGLAMALRVDVLVYLWAGLHFLCAARSRGQLQSTAR